MSTRDTMCRRSCAVGDGWRGAAGTGGKLPLLLGYSSTAEARALFWIVEGI